VSITLEPSNQANQQQLANRDRYKMEGLTGKGLAWKSLHISVAYISMIETAFCVVNLALTVS
jgi:hypothetical protein